MHLALSAVTVACSAATSESCLSFASKSMAAVFALTESSCVMSAALLIASFSSAIFNKASLSSSAASPYA